MCLDVMAKKNTVQTIFVPLQYAKICIRMSVTGETYILMIRNMEKKHKVNN